MKKVNVILLITGMIFILFSCSKDNSTLVSDLKQGDDATTSVKAGQVVTHFTGTSTDIPPDDPNVWYDAASDDRVTGVSIWVINEPVPLNEHTFKLTGTAEIFVGAEEYGDESEGKWEITWNGIQKVKADGWRIVIHAEGIGTEGDVLGLTANWKYTMDWVFTEPETFLYFSKGKITEEPE